MCPIRRLLCFRVFFSDKQITNATPGWQNGWGTPFFILQNSSGNFFGKIDLVFVPTTRRWDESLT